MLGVYGVQAQKVINHFMQNNGPDIFQHYNVMPHTMRKKPQKFHAKRDVNVLHWPALSPVLNPIGHVYRMNLVGGPGPIIKCMQEMTPIYTSDRMTNVSLTCSYNVT